jgi:AcrR family transcriptional regulator
MTWTQSPDGALAGAVEPSFTGRQQEVLSTVLDLMVETGDGFSVAAVARRARCSKETIYRWFGDRDGLLTATVQWQAAKVRMPDLPREGLSRDRYAAALEAFAVDWLTVITDGVSIALNRLAISHAGSGRSGLGRIVLDHGPYAMARRLKPIFELGREAGFIDLSPDDPPFRSFFGLVVGDVQIRVLLGDSPPDPDDIAVMARRAVRQFLLVHGMGERRPPVHPQSLQTTQARSV